MRSAISNDYSGYKSRFIWLAVFAIAMGFLEGIVVVYLRELYYPGGFAFPLKLLPARIVTIEWTREIATLIMLAGIGILTGRTNLQRLFYALFAFGVWDIFYYISLKIFLDWPASMLTWDILFLIPLTWLGPVLAPVINSLTMIMLALLIIGREESGMTVKIRPLDWVLIIGGALIILYTYLVDYTKLIIESGLLSGEDSTAASKALLDSVSSYVPDRYQWLPFIAGEILIIAAAARILIHSRRLSAG